MNYWKLVKSSSCCNNNLSFKVYPSINSLILVELKNKDIWRCIEQKKNRIYWNFSTFFCTQFSLFLKVFIFFAINGIKLYIFFLRSPLWEKTEMHEMIMNETMQKMVSSKDVSTRQSPLLSSLTLRKPCQE